MYQNLDVSELSGQVPGAGCCEWYRNVRYSKTWGISA